MQYYNIHCIKKSLKEVNKDSSHTFRIQACGNSKYKKKLWLDGPTNRIKEGLSLTLLTRKVENKMIDCFSEPDLKTNFNLIEKAVITRFDAETQNIILSLIKNLKNKIDEKCKVTAS